jgi:hypothetical protein
MWVSTSAALRGLAAAAASPASNATSWYGENPADTGLTAEQADLANVLVNDPTASIPVGGYNQTDLQAIQQAGIVIPSAAVSPVAGPAAAPASPVLTQSRPSGAILTPVNTPASPVAAMPIARPQFPYRSIQPAVNTPVAAPVQSSAGAAPAGYQPSSSDMVVYAAIGVDEPYTQAELTFAQAVEALAGSGVSPLNVFTQEEIQAAYTAYQSNGNSVATAQQSLQQSLAAVAAAQTETIASDGTVTDTTATTIAGISLTDWLVIAGGGILLYMVTKR